MINKQLYYLIIDIASISFPLLFSFHPSIQFYKQWKSLFPALMITAIAFIIWDEWFTRMGVWHFNSIYLTGIYLGHLPLEELLFFLLIPYCLMFMYHCSERYFELSPTKGKIMRYFMISISLLIFVIGVIHHDKWYTGFTFTITAILLILAYMTDVYNSINWLRFWVVYLLGLIPFFIVNGLLTSIPIVQYNNDENLSIRLTTIPIEDTVYNLLLFLCNVVLYEYYKGKNKEQRIKV